MSEGEGKIFLLSAFLCRHKIVNLYNCFLVMLRDEKVIAAHSL
jgi:hypothetical protein